MTASLLSVSYTLEIILGAVGGVIILGLLSWLIMYAIIARIVYVKVLRRANKDEWGRKPSWKDEDYLAMYGKGQEWFEKNKEKKTDVHIVHNKLNLYGEYFNFGGDRCVIVMSGRSEALNYGYFFAVPYAEMGINVLVLDARAHGMSDGKYNTCGFEESKDVIEWAKFVHDTFGVKSVILHGICIGSAGAMLALTDKDCPDYIDGMVAEGMFANFGESMKQHLVERKKPVFILNDFIDMWMRFSTGHSMFYGPINVIGRMKKPLLMLHSREDKYSTPELAQKLYGMAASGHKKLVWFEHGKHSMLRITDMKKYDRAIQEFLNENFINAEAA